MSSRPTVRIELRSDLEQDVRGLPGLHDELVETVRGVCGASETRGEPEVVLGACDPAGRAEVVVDGVAVEVPGQLRRRAAAVADPGTGPGRVSGPAETASFVAELRDSTDRDGLRRWTATIVHGAVLLALPRPLRPSGPTAVALAPADLDVLVDEPRPWSLTELIASGSPQPGIPVPPVELRADPTVHAGTWRWTLGGMPMPLCGGLRPGHLLVETPSVDGAVAHPLRGSSVTIEPSDGRPDDPDDGVWGTTELLAYGALTDLRWFPELLLDDDQVHQFLRQAEISAPALVDAVGAICPFAEVATMLRLLAAHRIDLGRPEPVLYELAVARGETASPGEAATRARGRLPRAVAVGLGAGGQVLAAHRPGLPVLTGLTAPDAASSRDAAERLRATTRTVADHHAGPLVVIVPRSSRDAVVDALDGRRPAPLVIAEEDLPPGVEVIDTEP